MGLGESHCLGPEAPNDTGISDSPGSGVHVSPLEPQSAPSLSRESPGCEPEHIPRCSLGVSLTPVLIWKVEWAGS